MGTDLPGTEDPGIEKVLLRGTAEILERDDDGIFLFDTVSEAYIFLRQMQKRQHSGYFVIRTGTTGCLLLMGIPLQILSEKIWALKIC